MPSSESAEALIHGEPAAALMVARDLGVRAVVLAAGLALAGEKEELVRKSLAGSAAIEAAVLLWTLATCPPGKEDETAGADAKLLVLDQVSQRTAKEPDA